MNVNSVYARASGLAIAAALLTSVSAGAQTRTPRPAEATLDEVVVTGTSIRGIEAVGSTATTINRETLAATGLISPSEVLKLVPQVQGLGFDAVPHVAQSGLSNIQRGSGISLRGLAQNATLLLVDGRRVATTGSGSNPYTEANQLPVSMLERVDVVADGASAIYGSEAIAGVVNYITRKRFDGLEISGRYTTSDGWDQKGGSLLAGKSWSEVGPLRSVDAVFALDIDHRSQMLAGEKGFLRQDLRPYGGADTRIRTNVATSGAPGNIVVPSTTANTDLPTAGANIFYGVPVGYSGTGLVGSQLLRNQPNLLDSADYFSFYPDVKAVQVGLNLNAEVSDNLSVYALSYYTRRTNEVTDLLQSPSNVTVPSTSPYYIPGVPGLAAGAREVVSFSFAKDNGASLRGVGGRSQYQQFGATFGAKKKLPHDWQAEAAFTANYSDTCFQCFGALEGNLNVPALQAAINDGSYNPFSSTAASPTVLARFLAPSYDRGKAGVHQSSLRFDGPAFALPAGDVRLAFGAEHLFTDTSRVTQGNQLTADTNVYAERKINAAYAEVFVPLLGDHIVPLVRKVSLDVAGRIEDYSDFGTTKNPKVGMVVDVYGGLRLRGAWGRSFRAAPLAQIEPGFFSSVRIVTGLANNTNDPTLPLTNVASRTSNVLNVSGANGNIAPERATNMTLGFDYRPDAVPGLHASFTYYKINYSNQIVSLFTLSNTFLASPTNRQIYASFITPAQQPAGCIPGNRSTYNPLIAAAIGAPSVSPVDEGNACSVVAIFDVRQTNASTTKQNGFDFDVGYDFDTSVGAFNVGVTGAYIFDNKLQVTTGVPVDNGLDRINFPISKRGRAGLGWTRDGLSANLWANYTGSYKNDLPLTISGVTRPISKVPAWVTIDLGLAYRFEASSGMTSGLRMSANVQNLFDRNPPVVLSTNGYAADVQTHSVFGRIVSIQVTKAF